MQNHLGSSRPNEGNQERLGIDIVGELKLLLRVGLCSLQALYIGYSNFKFADLMRFRVFSI
jgi:hypothetical protein